MEKPVFFESKEKLRRWFEKNHKTAEVLWLGYYKKDSGLPSIDWPQSVEQALCFGWIDGIRKSIDEKSYKIRFTPRRPNSHWSAVNIEMAERLIKEDQMEPAGLAAFKKRSEKNQKKASYEQKDIQLDKKYEAEFKTHPQAWHYFVNELSPYNRKTSIHWVMSAKREETRKRRLKTLIDSSSKMEKIPPLQISKK